MPPVQSKSVASHGNSTDLEFLYGIHDVSDDQHVYLDHTKIDGRIDGIEGIDGRGW